MLKVILITALVWFSSANFSEAQLIKKDASHFTKIGQLSSFTWAPENYQDATHLNPFTYDIFYYIPESLKNKSKVKAMIFNHGGGDSTLTREGSIHAVSLYAPDLQQLANDLDLVVVLPSANGLNWGGHTVGLMRELGKLMRAELNIDPDRLALGGHSMGGMGITRNYLWLADEFAFFLPMAAGMDLAPYTTPESLEAQLNKQFNVPYIHLQGLRDSFAIFVDRCKAQLAETKKLESRYGVSSKLNMHFYDTDHQYIYDVFKRFSRKAFRKTRDLYQAELWGSLLNRDNFGSEHNITFRATSVPRYFWVEAIDPDLTKGERIDFHAKVDHNDVKIDINTNGVTQPTNTSKLKIYLDSKLENLSKPIRIFVNGQIMGTRAPTKTIPAPVQMDPSDSGFIFEDSIQVSIPKTAVSP